MDYPISNSGSPTIDWGDKDIDRKINYFSTLRALFTELDLYSDDRKRKICEKYKLSFCNIPGDKLPRIGIEKPIA